uniref:Secreted protein n=1 Tax=Strongyloides venezuelensis TaxID=75913 RepID=A0A0K0EUS3_STRVS
MIFSNYIKQFILFYLLIEFVNSILPLTGMSFNVGVRGRPGFFNPQYWSGPDRRRSWHGQRDVRSKSPKRQNKKGKKRQPNIEITRL